MAQQRNLDDPETVVEFARMVRDQNNLDALMLLTLADGQGTSADGLVGLEGDARLAALPPHVAISVRSGGFLRGTEDRARALQLAIIDKLSPDYADELEAHFDYMPDNYFRAFGVTKSPRTRSCSGNFSKNFICATNRRRSGRSAWQAYPQQGHSTVSFCAWDGQELLAKIAGSFAVVPLNILSADIYTREDNVVLDIFRVCDLRFRAVTRRDATIVLVEETLQRAIGDQSFDFQPLLEKARRRDRARKQDRSWICRRKIIVENKSHPTYTLVQIATPDRLGLLYELLSAFGQEGVSIALSRISTEKGVATDTFYVVDAATRGKITDVDRIAALQQKLQQAALGTA